MILNATLASIGIAFVIVGKIDGLSIASIIIPISVVIYCMNVLRITPIDTTSKGLSE